MDANKIRRPVMKKKREEEKAEIQVSMGVLGIAYSILLYLIEDLEGREAVSAFNTIEVGAFSNCREQGFCLSFYRKTDSRAVCFSRNRNSDSIVVYYGLRKDFDNCTNLPDNWDNSKYFKESDYAGIAAFVRRVLLSDIPISDITKGEKSK
jgi:hypothetical protein